MWQIIPEPVAGGVSVFLTIQYLEEADELADRIGLLDQGRLVAEGARFGSCTRGRGRCRAGCERPDAGR